MRPILEYAEFDVVIVGSGIAGALVGHQLAQSGHRVLILEAGGVPSDSLGRWAMVHNFANSPSKAPDSPFCGDDVLPVDQTVDPKKDPGKYRFLQPSPIEDGGKNYYDYDVESISKKCFFQELLRADRGWLNLALARHLYPDAAERFQDEEPLQGWV